jgi:hypothetical protein
MTALINPAITTRGVASRYSNPFKPALQRYRFLREWIGSTLNIHQASPELSMRSFWMNRLLHHAYAGSRNLTQAPWALPPTATREMHKEGAALVRGANSRVWERPCLGIGDGSIRRQ